MKTKFKKLLLLTLFFPLFGIAQLPDISFSNSSWVLSSGCSYDASSGELTIIGNSSKYEYARITVNVPNSTPELYLSGDVFLENILLGSNVWDAPKMKITKTSGGLISAENFTSPAQGAWYNTYTGVKNYPTYGVSAVILEFGMQNSTGTYKIKLPKISSTKPAPTPYSFPFVVPANTTCNLAINTANKRTFNDDLLSTNCHFSWASKSWADTEVIDAINQYFPMSNYRFPGGTVGNFYNYLTDGYHNDASTFDNANRQFLYNNNFKFGYTGFKNQVASSSGSATLMFNVINDNVTTSANRLQSRVNDGLNVKWVELGNENYFSHQSFGYIAGGWKVVDVDAYINHTTALTTALKAISPTVGVAVNIDHLTYDVGKWSNRLSQETYYDATVLHNYVNVAVANLDFNSGSTLLGAYKTTRNNLSKYKSYFGTTPVLISEWGALGSNSFLGVIAAADVYMALLEGDLQDDIVKQAGIHMFYHSDSNVPHTLMYLDGGTTKFSPTGAFYSKLFEVFKGKEIYTDLSVSADIDPDLPGVISKAVDYGDSIIVFSTNKLPVTSELEVTLDGTPLIGGYRMETFSTTNPADWPSGFTNPNNAWVKTIGAGEKVLAAYSLTVTTIAKSNIITATNEIKVGDFKVYPNPSSDYVFFDGVKMNEKYQMFDASGKLVLNGKVSSTGIDVSILSPGIYVVKVGLNSKRLTVH